MKYLGVCYTGFVILLCILSFFVDKRISKGDKNKLLKYKSPLYYSYEKTDYFSKYFGVCCLIVYFLVILVLILIRVDVVYLQYLEKVINNINEIEGLFLGYTAMVVSVLIFSVTLSSREYYLTINRSDIIKKYHLNNIYQVIGLSSFVSVICTGLLQSYDLNTRLDQIIFLCYQTAIVLLMGAGNYAIFIIGKITFSSSKFELHSLKYLYRIFWSNSVLKVTSKTEDTIYVNLSYLLQKYVHGKCVKKILKDITLIEFDEDIFENTKWYKVASNIVLGGGVFSTSISTLFLIKKNNYVLVGISLVLFCIVIFILKYKKIVKFFGKYIINLVLDRNGYIVRINDKYKFIGNVSFYRNVRIEQYIRGIKNLMAMYCILCNCFKGKMVERIKDSYIDMIDYLSEYEGNRKKFEKALYYLPVFACSYYYYIYYESHDFPKEIIELFKSFNLSSEERERYHKILNGFISDSSRFRLTKKDKQAVKLKVSRKEYYNNYIGKSGYWQILIKE